MRRRLFVAALLVLAFTGAGCLKQKAPTPPTPQPTAPSTPPVVTFETTETGDAAINAELDFILKNFRTVKSFRMKLTSEAPQGELKSTLEFLRPDRFRGTMQLASQPSMDIVVVEDSLYLRPQNGAWVDLSGTSSAKSVGTALRNALSGDASLDKIGVDPSSIVKKTRDDGRQCDLFKATVKTPDGKPAALEICAANGLPHYVTITSAQGPLTFEYYDYNALFLIERPI